MARQHHQSPERLGGPWVDIGLIATRSAGLCRVSLCPPGAGRSYWIGTLAGLGSISGATAEQALTNAARW